MKKNFIITSLALCLVFAGCTKESTNENSNASTNEPLSNQLTQDMLTGYWFTNGSSYHETYCLKFNYDGEMGNVYYEDLYDNSKGVIATGIYTISGMNIIANFSWVDVGGGLSEPDLTTWHGFTHGQPHTMTFKVKSVTATELVLQYEDGHTFVYSSY